MNNEQKDGARPVFGPETLLFGIGNCARGDDGLGWAFLDRIQQDPAFEGRAEYRYQLQVEDAALVREAERVVFVDSFRGVLPGGYSWTPCEPSRDFEFTTHVLPPQAVLYYCLNLYGKAQRADLMMIQGSCWDLGMGISPESEHHLDKALRHFKEVTSV